MWYGLCPFWKQRKKKKKTTKCHNLFSHWANINRIHDLTTIVSLSSCGIYIIFFPKMKKTKNRLVWVINHVPLYTIEPLWTKAFQTSWLFLEVVHLLLRKNYQKKKNLNFYHILKPRFYFSNVEMNKKKIILQRELSNLHQSIV